MSTRPVALPLHEVKQRQLALKSARATARRAKPAPTEEALRQMDARAARYHLHANRQMLLMLSGDAVCGEALTAIAPELVRGLSFPVVWAVFVTAFRQPTHHSVVVDVRGATTVEWADDEPDALEFARMPEVIWAGEATADDLADAARAAFRALVVKGAETPTSR